MSRTIESTLGISRRILNLLVDNQIHGIKSLCCVDLNRQKFFHPPPSTATIGAGSESVAAGASKTQTPAASVAGTAASVMEKFRLRNPTFTFKAEGVPGKWKIDCFPLADRKVICADQSGRAFLLDADSRHVATMPKLHKSKWMPISIFVPNTDADQGGGSKLYIMESVPKPEAACCTLPSDQFEAFVYHRPTDSWHCELLPPPPFVRDPKYRKVSEWTLPFNGKVEYVPELKLWFGLAAESGNLAAADLSSIFTMDSQPQLVGSASQGSFKIQALTLVMS
ncbi:hypothetical protein QOZ80_7AG0577120 [Eleusine coracana subsp. coracana]|nr:hypothetical protein QOZ80_7AG0577120 [Eleusine coracana subsp. coracana]